MKDSKPGIIQNLSALGIADLGTAVIGGVFWLVIATLIDPEDHSTEFAGYISYKYNDTRLILNPSIRIINSRNILLNLFDWN